MSERHQLITGMGKRDKEALAPGGTGKGPILNLLRHGPAFSTLHLLVDPGPEMAAAAEALQTHVAREYPTMAVARYPLGDVPLHEYEPAYIELRRAALEALRDTPPDTQTWINVSSGFPVWQTIWFLLVHSGQVPARLVHVRGPGDVDRYGGRVVNEVDIKLDAFPRVEAPYGKACLESELLRRDESERRDLEALRAFALEKDMVFVSQAMAKLVRTIQRMAHTPAPVLICGETGVGKEAAARLIHHAWAAHHGGPATPPFVALNCGGIPESLLESELFGHEKGAFTGATGRRKGVFEQAEGGVLFLDEIGDAGPRVQVALLRAIQEGEIRRVGGTETIKVHVRVVAATNRDPAKAIAEGHLREDLYYRLKTFTLTIPPLRERPEDILPLARRFLEKHKPEARGPAAPVMTKEFERALCERAWPGNVRDLGSAIHHAVVLADGPLTPDLLPPADTAQPSPLPSVHLPEDGIDLQAYLDQLKDQFIEEALRRTGGNQKKADALLGYAEGVISTRRSRRAKGEAKD